VEDIMRKVSIAAVLTSLAAWGVLAWMPSFSVAQPRPTAPGYHLVSLATEVKAGARPEPQVLLETPHLKLVKIVVPKGGVLPAHSAPTQVSVQALSGAGEFIVAGKPERIDASHMIVLAPNMEHEVRASADADLVLLIHHLLAGPARGGHGPGPGRKP
jgi:quercetin dioxygenase-like cupin family protein